MDILVELVVRVIMMIIRAFPGNVMLIRTVTVSYQNVGDDGSSGEDGVGAEDDLVGEDGVGGATVHRW